MLQHRKLEPDFKRRWIEALNSWDRKQGKGALCSKNEDGEWCFCCLGVAADINHIPWSEKNGWLREFYFSDSKERYRLPDDYQNLAPWTLDYLADMNDAGYSFREIAFWIEQNL